MDVSTGAILLPIAPGRHIEALGDGVLANVSELKGEYFFNPHSGKRTPHPGWVTEAGLEPGAPGLPATTVKPGGEVTGPIGYVGLAAPGWRSPSSSRRRPSAAATPSSSLRRTGTPSSTRGCTGSAASGPGHRARRCRSRREREGGRLPRLRAGWARRCWAPTCERSSRPGRERSNASRSPTAHAPVLGADGRRSLVVLPGGSRSPRCLTGSSMPSARPSSPTESPDGGNMAKRVQAIGSGGVAQLAAVSTCNHVGKAWVACESRRGACCHRSSSTRRDAGRRSPRSSPCSTPSAPGTPPTTGLWPGGTRDSSTTAATGATARAVTPEWRSEGEATDSRCSRAADRGCRMRRATDGSLTHVDGIGDRHDPQARRALPARLRPPSHPRPRCSRRATCPGSTGRRPTFP